MSAWFNLMADIWLGLRGHPARALLSFAGIAIGAASLAVLIAVAGGLRQKAAAMETEFGADVISISQQAGEADVRKPIQRGTVHYLRANLPACEISACQEYSIPGAGNKPSFRLIATDEHLPNVKKWALHAGRFPDPSDIRLRRRVVALNRPLAERLNLHPGDTFPIQQTPFSVIGIVETGPSSAAPESFGEFSAYIPWTIKPHWIESYWIPEERIDAIFIKTGQPGSLEGVLEQARALMEHPDRRVPNLEWTTPQRISAQVRSWQRLIEWTAGGIALLCLALGGATLMSLMVSNIQERIPEIGLRVSLGADSAQIVLLFVGEALATTLLAALAGTWLAFVLLAAAQSRLPTPLLITPRAFLLALGITLFMGVLFSIWPALAASRISPAEALRND